MQKHRIALAVAMAFPLAAFGQAASTSTAATAGNDAPIKTLGVVSVTGGQPTSLPTQIPTTMEGITREQIENTINATDSEDVIKYFPSLLVRKRYVGDYNHAILSSRASGTGNSARSAVYADGILLSNYLGNGVGGLSFPPRWGMVTPEEIDRVDVMYGPFSAAYPGNSVGAVVDYVTRMPTKLEAHAKFGTVIQPFNLYNTKETYKATQASASVGNRTGDWSWWLNANQTDSHSQPLTFATRLVGSGTPGVAGTPVSGAVLDRNNANQPWYIVGTGTEYRTKQDHLKAKVAYDINPGMRLSYLFGLWQNTSEGRPVSYLRDAAGNSVYSGGVNINGRAFTGGQALTGGDFVLTNEKLEHYMHGLSLKTNTRGTWDWELSASLYRYAKDENRRNAAGNPLPAAANGGAGSIADGSGTGWNTLAARGTWRPDGMKGALIVDFGVQQDSYRLRYLTSNITGNWLSDGAGAMSSSVGGETRLRSLWGQDTWSFAKDWKTVLGLRLENWQASDGYTQIPGAVPAINTAWAKRSENYLSPKAAVSWQALNDMVLKASVGRAVRMPTVGELYGATSTTNSRYINDPNLKPEKSWTGELSAEKDLGHGILRLTAFAENTRDSLYSQTVFDPVALVNVSRVQNVDEIATKGLEAGYNGNDVWITGLDLLGSVTWTDSTIKRNSGFVVFAGDTVGKKQPNIADWRATVQAAYRVNDHWSGSVAARYSGPQYRTLNNSDVYGFTYQGVSKFFVVDLRARYRFDKQWSASFGIDNLNNHKYWNFHPYPQRSFSADLKFDL